MAKKEPNVDVQAVPTLHLSHEDLTGLGLHKGKTPAVGDKLPVSAMFHVKGVGETESGRHMHGELHDMSFGSGKKQVDDAEMKQGMKGAIEKAIGSESKDKGKGKG